MQASGQEGGRMNIFDSLKKLILSPELRSDDSEKQNICTPPPKNSTTI